MKRFAWVLAALLCLAAAGCGGQWEAPPSRQEEAKAPAKQEAAPEPALEPLPEPEESDAESPPEQPDTEPSPEQPSAEPLPPPDSEEPDAEPLPPPEPAAEDFVRVVDYIPDLQVDLRYATADNFTGEVIYTFTDAYLRYGTVEKLAAAQESLQAQGYGLLIWDAFRPVSAQFALWEICPDSRYVADPNKGFSSHSRGNTVDVTLVSLDGGAVAMPTDFDDFSAKADRDYSDVDGEAASHAAVLERAMTEAGFRPYSGEWWHFSDAERYDVETAFAPGNSESEENGNG